MLPVELIETSSKHGQRKEKMSSAVRFYRNAGFAERSLFVQSQLFWLLPSLKARIPRRLMQESSTSRFDALSGDWYPLDLLSLGRVWRVMETAIDLASSHFLFANNTLCQLL